MQPGTTWRKTKVVKNSSMQYTFVIYISLMDTLYIVCIRIQYVDPLGSIARPRLHRSHLEKKLWSFEDVGLDRVACLTVLSGISLQSSCTSNANTDTANNESWKIKQKTSKTICPITFFYYSCPRHPTQCLQLTSNPPVYVHLHTIQHHVLHKLVAD